MSKVDIVSEMLKSHTDAEITEHLYRVMAGVVKNYKVSLDKGDPSVLWSSVGDIEQVATVLQAINKRNQLRLAQTQMQE